MKQLFEVVLRRGTVLVAADNGNAVYDWYDDQGIDVVSLRHVSDDVKKADFVIEVV